MSDEQQNISWIGKDGVKIKAEHKTIKHEGMLYPIEQLIISINDKEEWILVPTESQLNIYTPGKFLERKSFEFIDGILGGGFVKKI